MIKRFRKIPTVVRAVQFDGHNFRECRDFLEGQFDNTLNHPNVKTLHGVARVDPGDWVIKGEGGDFWPCKPDVFCSSYEEVDEG